MSVRTFFEEHTLPLYVSVRCFGYPHPLSEIVYINAVRFKKRFGIGQITGDFNETIRFQCSYKRDAFRFPDSELLNPVSDISIFLSE